MGTDVDSLGEWKPRWTFFLCYAHDDRAAAEHLYGHLAREHPTFLDCECIPPGSDWDRAIGDAHADSQVSVVLVSERSRWSGYQRSELHAALAYASGGRGHSVVPIYLGGWPRQEDQVLYGLRLKQGFAVSPEQGLGEIAAALSRWVRGVRPPEALPGATREPHPPANTLADYPRGPLVELHRIPRELVEGFAALYSPTEAPMVLAAAVALRLDADPGDPKVTYVKPYDVPAPANVPARQYWWDVFEEARRHGPRMLAALLLQTEERLLPAPARSARAELLTYLRGAVAEPH